MVQDYTTYIGRWEKLNIETCKVMGV